MIQAKLLVVGGGEVEQEEFALTLPATIGRGRENLITLAHPLVSRVHCEIFEEGSQLMVRDLGSLNGTYVGSQRIESPRALETGDLLTIGIVTFRTVLPETKRGGLRLESVFDEDSLGDASDDTQLAANDWPPKGPDSDTLRENADSIPSANPRRAK